jgi:PAP2 superfamily
MRSNSACRHRSSARPPSGEQRHAGGVPDVRAGATAIPRALAIPGIALPAAAGPAAGAPGLGTVLGATASCAAGALPRAARQGRLPELPARLAWRLAQNAAALRSWYARHPALRYLQIIPVALILWGSDVADKFRAGAAAIGLRNALVVDDISRRVGGGIAGPMNAWLAAHPLPGTAAAWFYILMQGAVAGLVGLLLIWRRTPSFGLHRNALIACNLIGLVVFFLYPVAPPRMLPGYHDITGSAVPFFSSILEGKAADLYASLPSLHVTWALWVAVALTVLLWRHPVLRVAVWLYPVATIIDVLATANHYMLDVIAAPGVLLLAYAIATTPALARRAARR